KADNNWLPKFLVLEKNQDNIQNTIRQENAINRQEISNNIKMFTDLLLNRVSDSSLSQKNQLDTFQKSLSMLTDVNEQKLSNIRETLDVQLKHLQEDNMKKLEEMRFTVDEKLHSTLEQRLGDSFKMVSDKLESVYKGLGEMQSLASNVGDLKRMLTNVKTRGIWGEIQLGAILEQILTKEQYEQNVSTKKGSSDRVEFALRLPGRNNTDEPVWLPIDAKFPHEDYERIMEAEQQGQFDAVEKAVRQLEVRIKNEAKNIYEKYIDPPYTTDFAIMFLPTEGLYAEVLRRKDLCEIVQQKYRVIISGPTTLTALLNSLQMGFRTLAIEKRSSEIWELLGTIKNDFKKFGTVLEKTKKKLKEAHNTIEDAERKSRKIEKKLDDVQGIPYTQEKEEKTEELEEVEA
ncbi:DNA recombination protein RmuC, partial [bacterium]